MYVIAASPITKVFLPEWHARCIENPELMFDETERFLVRVKRSVGAINLDYGVPTLVNAGAQSATRTLFNWLTGGEDGARNQETDMYGITVFDPNINVLAEVSSIVDMEMFSADMADYQKAPDETEDAFNARVAKARKKIEEKQAKMQREVIARFAAAKKKAREIADDRVKRMIRMNWNYLVQQWQHNEEAGGKKHPPTDSEYLGSLVIQEELAASSSKMAKKSEQMHKLFQKVGLI